MAETMIEVQDLTKHFGAVQALRGVSFSVPRGQVVGLIGPNGAGKTTAMRVVTGFLAPTTGTARVAGLDVLEEPMACRRRIGYLPEGNPQYLDLKVKETLRFAARMHGMRGSDADAAVGEVVDVAGLHGVESRLVGTVSKGYRQRVGLATALLHKPDVLILDEPSSGLDPNQQAEMRVLLRRLGEEHTVIFSTHILSEVEAVCDRVLFIHDGLLAADGTVADIRGMALRGPVARLVVEGTVEAARAAFAPEGGSAVTVESHPTSARHVRVEVGLGDGALDHDRFQTLAATAREAGLALCELNAERSTLEAVFADLTRGRRDVDSDSESDADEEADAVVATETPSTPTPSEED